MPADDDPSETAASNRFAAEIASRDRGEIDAAVASLNTRLARDPADAEGWALLSHCLSLKEQDAEAWTAVKNALKLDPAAAATQRNLARLLLKKSNFDAALDAARAAAEAAPDDVENKMALATALAVTGELAQSARLTDEALGAAPGYAEAYIHRASLRMRGGDVKAAAADLETALSIKPHLAQVWVLLAGLRQRMQDRAGAIEALENALEREPSNLAALLQLVGLTSRAGEIARAGELLARATQLAPERADVWRALGDAHRRCGRFDEARKALETALDRDPDNADTLNLLGALAMDAGDPRRAEEYFRRFVARTPVAAAHRNLGVALLALHQPALAYDSLQRALELEPDVAEAHAALARALMGLGRLGEALDSAERAVALDPANVNALNALGVALAMSERTDEAINALERSLEVAPELAINHGALGGALMTSGDLQRATTHLRRAVELAPRSAKAHLDLGNALLSQGATEPAAELLEQAVALDPMSGEAHRCLAMTRRYAEGDAHLRQMLALERGGDLGPTERVHLCFALAKALEDAGAYDQAFAQMVEGNRRRRASVSYSTERRRALFDRVMRAFPSAAPSADQRDDDIAPIFVLGMPRSGTTLIEQVLASHPQVSGGGELPYLNRLLRPVRKGDGVDIEAILREPGFGDLLASSYLDALRAHAAGRAFVTDKTPTNFTWIGFIKLAFPNARIVHLARDPRDTCLSIFKNYFSDRSVRFAYDLGEIAQLHRLHDDLMRHWRAIFPDQIHELRYESFVADQEAETRRLLAYCGLDWSEDCLDFHKTDRLVLTASRAQTRQPLSAQSVGLWRRYGDALAPMIAELEAAGVI